MEVGVHEGHELMEPDIGGEDDTTECCTVEPAVAGDSIAVNDKEIEKVVPKADGMVLEPYVGLEFESLESARSFYSSYAKRLDFGTRVSYSHRSRRDRNITAQQYVCSMEGFSPSSNEGPSKHARAGISVGCHASMTVKRAGPTKWVVKSFEKCHNHDLANLNQLQMVQVFKDMDAAGSNVYASEASGGEDKRQEDEACVSDNALVEDFQGRDLFVTKRDSNLEPYVGMVFESEVEARAYYNAYARRVGFGTRINYSHRSRRDKSMIAQQYVCDKEGFRLNKEGTKKRHRADTRVGCKALLNVRKVGPGIWVVKTFEREHNHPLASPSQVQFLRSHRGASDVPRHQISSLHKGDTQSILDYFKHMQNDNTSFFYAIQVDNDNCMTNAFWLDATSRMNYNYFGDMVTFDTSYLMKKYGVPFAPFIGVNHHNQPVLFGCALLTDESESSFVWLFKVWLSAMSGKAPTSIVTDQDRNIQAAVAKVFPETQHRYCMWNIERKFPEKFGAIYRSHKNFKEEFQKCIYETSTINEFESKWELLLEKFGLGKNEWLELLYEDRKFWAPVFLKGVFFAGMPSNPSSECISSFFDEYISAGGSLEEFVQQYDNTLDNLHHKEVEADYETLYTTPNLKTSSPMEKQAASLYTREMFKQFQVELFECFGYVAKKVTEDGAIKTYRVAKFGEDHNHNNVEFIPAEIRATCDCHMFEFMGILCRHVLNVFRVANVFMLPDHYVLKRWTKNAKSKDLLAEGNIEIRDYCQQSMMLRYNDLCRRAMKIAEEGARTAEGYRMAMWGLHAASEQVAIVNDSVIGFSQPGLVGGSMP
ncbi:protein FAR1-RELATED SEQUENCE 9-like [Aristolochia californica]|uniref:protein FAR1-RELATED SEQUENCE 9-like n=1 Tax=Aristolochia californica TaxID=171875 RepID=UPI0035E314DB